MSSASQIASRHVDGAATEPGGRATAMVRPSRGPSGRDVRTVVFSAVPPSAQRVQEFRPLGVLTKPFPIEALLRFVGKARDAEDEE